jgi:biopolymer transport protein ExbB/biopolymer transport protein TolQ
MKTRAAKRGTLLVVALLVCASMSAAGETALRRTLLAQVAGASAPAITISEATPAPQQAGALIEITFFELLKRTGWPNRVVLLVLLIMAFRMLSVAWQRRRAYTAAKQQSREYAPRVAQALKNERLEEAIDISAKYTSSHLAVIVNAGLQELQMHERFSDVSYEELAACGSAMGRVITFKSLDFRRGLFELSSIGSTSMMLGLLGLVLGLVQAGWGAGRSGQVMSAPEIMADVASGLLPLMLGLAVGVLARWRLSVAKRKLAEFDIEMENSASEVIDFLYKNRGRVRAGTEPEPKRPASPRPSVPAAF